MNTNQFYLLIIIIILIIIISLFIQCNKKVLKNLEENATKDIIETYYHLGSAAPTEPGQKGYKISSISEGKYGGRSSQEVLNNIGSHTVKNYISIEEKDSYDSNLFNPNISGDEKKAIDCKTGGSRINVNCKQVCYNGKLSYIYDNIKPAQYGGKSCSGLLDHIDSNNIGYKYVLKDGGDYCSDVADNYDYNLTTIIFLNDYSGNYTITDIVESNWCGFFKSNEIFNILHLTGIKNGSIITNDKLDILINNQNSPSLSVHKYKKYKKNRKYYELKIKNSDTFERTYRNTNSQKQLEIPITGIYEIMARGAIADMGPMFNDTDLYKYIEAAQIKGRILLTKGDKINIRVGGNGVGYTEGYMYISRNYCGGGGGTYIVKDKDNPKKEHIIVIAGGSGWYDLFWAYKEVISQEILESARSKLFNKDAGEGYGGYDYTKVGESRYWSDNYSDGLDDWEGGTGGGGFLSNGEDSRKKKQFFPDDTKFDIKGGTSYINNSTGVGTKAKGGYGGGGEFGGGGGYTGGNAYWYDHRYNNGRYLTRYRVNSGGTSYNNFDSRLGDVEYKHSMNGGFASIKLIKITE